MRKAFSFLCILICLCGSAKSHRTVKLVSYNVGAFHKYMEDSAPMVAGMMKEVGADFVALQETDSCTARCGRERFEVEEFARERMEGWDFNFTKTINYKGGAYGIGAVCSPEFKTVGKYGYVLPASDGSETRCVSVLETEKIVFASTHLDHKGVNARMDQAKAVTEWMKTNFGKSGKIVVLCGDFNCYPDDKAMEYFKTEWDVVSDTAAATFPKSGKCIDYILILKNGVKYRVKSAATLDSFKSGDARKASDHFPTMVTIRF